MGGLGKAVGNSFDPMTGAFNPGGLLSEQVRNNNILKRSMMKEDLKASEARRQLTQQMAVQEIKAHDPNPETLRALRRTTVEGVVAEGGTRKEGRLQARAMGLGQQSIDDVSESRKKLIMARTEMTDFTQKQFGVNLPNVIGLFDTGTFNQVGGRIVIGESELANELKRIKAQAGANMGVADHQAGLERELLKLQAGVNERYDINHSARLDENDKRHAFRGMEAAEYGAFLQEEVDSNRINHEQYADTEKARAKFHMDRRLVKARSKFAKELFSSQTGDRKSLATHQSGLKLAEMATKGDIDLSMESFKHVNDKEMVNLRDGLAKELAKYESQLTFVGDTHRGKIQAKVARIKSNLAMTEAYQSAKLERGNDTHIALLDAGIKEAQAAKDWQRAASLETQRSQHALELMTQTYKEKGALASSSSALAVERARMSGRYTVSADESSSIRRRIYGEYASLFGRDVVDAQGNITDVNLRPEDRDVINQSVELAKMLIENYGTTTDEASSVAIRTALVKRERSPMSFENPFPRSRSRGLWGRVGQGAAIGATAAGLAAGPEMAPAGAVAGAAYATFFNSKAEPTQEDIDRSLSSFRYALNREAVIQHNPELRRYGHNVQVPGGADLLARSMNDALDQAGIPAEFVPGAGDAKSLFRAKAGYNGTKLPKSYLNSLGKIFVEVLGRVEM